MSSLATRGQPGEQVPAWASCLRLGVAGGVNKCMDTWAWVEEWVVEGWWMVDGWVEEWRDRWMVAG